jgi:hypothetical protein
MRHTLHTLGRLTEETIPEEAKETLLARFREWKAAG